MLPTAALNPGVLPGFGKKMPLAPTGFPLLASGTSPHCKVHHTWTTILARLRATQRSLYILTVKPLGFSETHHTAGMRALVGRLILRQADIRLAWMR